MGIHPMDGALVGAGSLWPPPLSTCKPSAFEQRAFCTLHLERLASPNFFGFTLSNYYRDCVLFLDPCPCPVSASGTDDMPSMAPCLQNQIGGFFFFFDEFYYVA
jgi:hypothetical protein